MPTQAQINLAAYKSGKKPEEIQRLLQEKQGTSAPNTQPVQNVQTNTPVKTPQNTSPQQVNLTAYKAGTTQPITPAPIP